MLKKPLEEGSWKKEIWDSGSMGWMVSDLDLREMNAEEMERIGRCTL